MTAIPIVGLAGCGGDCGPDYDDSRPKFGAAQWVVGSEHSRAECLGAGCYDLNDTCHGADVTGCRLSSASTVVCHLHPTYCYHSPCGRLPAGLVESADAEQPSIIAAYLANATRLEGASVFAFGTVERELIAHGAPAQLIARAGSAQRDEKRHYRAMSGLARRFGAQAYAVEIDDVGVRPLQEIAVENAIEGCVRETFGAAVAAFQGECAGDRAVGRAMRSIAADEAEHAALGWAIDSWAGARLQPAGRARVQAARHEALELLIAQAREPIAPEVCAVLGLPDAAASARMLTALAPLWSGPLSA